MISGFPSSNLTCPGLPVRPPGDVRPHHPFDGVGEATDAGLPSRAVAAAVGAVIAGSDLIVLLLLGFRRGDPDGVAGGRHGGGAPACPEEVDGVGPALSVAEQDFDDARLGRMPGVRPAPGGKSNVGVELV